MTNSAILVNGYPATGKSTLASRLSRDLGVPAISKDQIKEFFADALAVNSNDWSIALRHASDTAMIGLLRAHAGPEPLILESAFIREFVYDGLSEALTHTGKTALELYCRTDREERLRRSNRRLEQGLRHPIHRDSQTIHAMSEAALEAKYQPLRLGEYVVVDTTIFGDAEYETVLMSTRQFIGGEQ